MTNDAFITILTGARAGLDTAIADAANGRRPLADGAVRQVIDQLEYVDAKRAAFHRELEAVSGVKQEATKPGGTQP